MKHPLQTRVSLLVFLQIISSKDEFVIIDFKVAYGDRKGLLDKYNASYTLRSISFVIKRIMYTEKLIAYFLTPFPSSTTYLLRDSQSSLQRKKPSSFVVQTSYSTI